MIEGVDYAFSQPSVTGLAAAGKRFAMRYIGPGTDDKHLHAVERDQIWAAGMQICLLAEGAANSALGGFSVGQDHGRSSLSAARALGAPDSVPIYYAVDFDVTASQWPTAAAYLIGAGSVVGKSRVGIYGGIRAMQWAARDGVASWFFQTFAWSAGQWYAGNHVEQYENDVNLAGGVVDLCRARQPNYGQWAPTGPVPTTPGVDMYFLSVSNGGQYVADSNFERVWAFDNNTLFQKVYAAAGKPPTQQVDESDIFNGVFGHYMGVYTVPRQAPATGGGTNTGNYTITFSGQGEATPD